jgi:hypothetical protein
LPVLREIFEEESMPLATLARLYIQVDGITAVIFCIMCVCIAAASITKAIKTIMEIRARRIIKSKEGENRGPGGVLLG